MTKSQMSQSDKNPNAKIEQPKGGRETNDEELNRKNPAGCNPDSELSCALGAWNFLCH
jgi:hypothetical protein